MNKTCRRPVIAGNWKMNETPAQARTLINELKASLAGYHASDIVICVPFVDLPEAVELTAGSNLGVGAQNVHFAAKGAYTGEISADMLTELGVRYVIIGHSERRTYFGETDETVNLRVKAALAAGLRVICCVGETLVQRDRGVTGETVAAQVKIALLGVTREQLADVIFAYEPVWAIGTGRVATSEQAEQVCRLIRETVAGLYDQSAADALRIQYGGSMKPENCAELLAQPDIDGGLIGGASLKEKEFTAIIAAAE